MTIPELQATIERQIEAWQRRVYPEMSPFNLIAQAIGDLSAISSALDAITTDDVHQYGCSCAKCHAGYYTPRDAKEGQ